MEVTAPMKASDHPASTSAGVTSDHTAAEPNVTRGTPPSAQALAPGTASTPNIPDSPRGRAFDAARSGSRCRSTGTIAAAVHSASAITAARHPHAS